MKKKSHRSLGRRGYKEEKKKKRVQACLEAVFRHPSKGNSKDHRAQVKGTALHGEKKKRKEGTG